MSVTRWVQDGLEFITIDASPDSIYLYNVSGGKWSTELTSHGSSLFSFVRPEDADSDNFDLVESGVVVFSHRGDATVEHEYMPPPYQPYSQPPVASYPGPGDWNAWTGGEYDERPQIPQSDMQRRQIETYEYRRYILTQFPTQRFDEKISLSSGLPWVSDNNPQSYTVKITALHPFPNFSDPVYSSSDEIDEMLSDPVSLFNSDAVGVTHVVDGGVVVPFSNTQESWVETYDFSEFCTIVIEPTSYPGSVTTSSVMYAVGYYDWRVNGYYVSGHYSQYRPDDIPEVFTEELTLSESDLELLGAERVKIPQYNIEPYDRENPDMMMQKTGTGTLYGTHNRATWSGWQLKDGDEELWNTFTQTV